MEETTENEVVETTHEQSAAPEQSEQDLIDLEKLEKFKYGGKEWTPQDFKSKYIPYSKYQRDISSSEKKHSEESNYWNNLRYDLDKVKANPALIDDFKRIYPEKFHDYLRYVQSQAVSQPGQQTANQVNDPRVDQLAREWADEKKARQEVEIASCESQIDVALAKFSPKYPLADVGVVLNAAEKLLNDDKNLKLDDRKWESIFKEIHGRFKGIADTYYKGIVTKQKQASAKGRDSAPGGGIPGQAPKRLNFKEAGEAMIRDLTQGRGA